MDTFTAIEQRRSVKAFDPAHQMTGSELEKLISATILAPTAFNLQHWRFVLVEDIVLRDQVKAAAYGQAQVTDASAVFVLCGDLNAWQKDPVQYWVNAVQPMQDYLRDAIDGYYRGREQVQRDEVMRSGGLAAQTMMLAAKAMGYDSCAMDGFDFDAVAQLINLPEDHAIVMMIAVGKALSPANPRGGQLPVAQVLLKNGFSA
jgi:nitroreductase